MLFVLCCVRQPYYSGLTRPKADCKGFWRPVSGQFGQFGYWLLVAQLAEDGFQLADAGFGAVGAGLFDAGFGLS